MNFPFNNKGFFPILPAIMGAGKAIAGSGLLKTAGSMIGKFAGSSIGSSALNGIGSAVGGALGGKLTDKITGIPSALSATEQGTQASEYMNAAYPGTTAWDRLGAGGGGSPSALSASNVERMKMRQENQMQSRQLSTQAMIADRQNRSHLIGVASGYGIDGIKQVLNAYDGFRQPIPYDTPVKQGRDKTPSEIHRNEYGSASSSTAQAAKFFGSQLFDSQQAVGKWANNEKSKLKQGFDKTKKFFGDKFNDFKSKIPMRFNFSPIRK